MHRRFTESEDYMLSLNDIIEHGIANRSWISRFERIDNAPMHELKFAVAKGGRAQFQVHQPLAGFEIPRQ